MMQRIQSLFSRLAGIATFEAERLARAQAIFADADRRYGRFDSPAYLRRRTRVAVSNGIRFRYIDSIPSCFRLTPLRHRK